MSKLQVMLMLRSVISVILLYMKDLLFLPLDTFVLVTTIILLKIIQKLFIFLIDLNNETSEIFSEAGELLKYYWNAAIQLFVFFCDYYIVSLPCEHSCI